MEQQEQLQHLFTSQKLSVLATQSDGQPHGCLVAFAVSNDLKYMFFVTRRKTRKYSDILTNPQVAMLTDNRSNLESDFQNALAVTTKGTAKEVTGTERKQWELVYNQKHPYLKNFIGDQDVALILIEVEEYLIATFSSTTVYSPQ